jgi:4-amino-4-deoxychorismate lyase
LTGRWFQNDREVETVPIGDRALHYGDGLFETIAVRSGQPRLLDLHLDRLELGCHRLNIDKRPIATIPDGLQFAIKTAGFDGADCTAKIILSRGEGRRGYAPSAMTQPVLRIGIFERTSYPVEYYRDGIVVSLSKVRLARQPQLAGIKTLNRLEQVLAAAEHAEPGCTERLMMDTEGNLICGTMSNVFLVLGSTVMTPAITHAGICGVMRRHLLRTADKLTIDCEAARIQPEMLQQADEVFVTNSQIGLWPVRACGKLRWRPGPVTRRLMAGLEQAGISECRL